MGLYRVFSLCRFVFGGNTSDVARVSSLAISCLLLWTLPATADLQTVWRIGVDGDPYQSGYDPTGEFSQENGLNDPRPGQVTRLPGDPLYSGSTNAADDDFYCAGTSQSVSRA